jgi:hypothetical protein
MGDVRGFCAALGLELPDRGGTWLRVNCIDPDHEDLHGSCDVNVETGGFHCKSCGAQGNAYKAALLAGLSPADAARLANDHGLWEGDWSEPRGGGGVCPHEERCNRAPPRTGPRRPLASPLPTWRHRDATEEHFRAQAEAAERREQEQHDHAAVGT